jgi:alpha-ketoglutarate-dependent 2,4-dichlorophenoxyacetate dioxygenase
MSISIRQIHPVFIGEVSGIDLRQPLTPAEVKAIDDGMDRYGVLVFHGQDITDEQQVAFSRNFGKIEQAVGSNVTKPEDRRLSLDLADVSNLDKNNQVLARDNRQRMFNLGNRLWHSDSSFRAVPSKYSLLSGRRVPPPEAGGNTEFADMRAAYDALDDATKAKIEDLVCEHSLLYSRGSMGFGPFTEAEQVTFKPVRQRLVRTNANTGRKSLYLSSHIGTIIGWPMPEARDFIRELVEHATQRKFVHAHVWTQYDLVIWDNRQVMHRVRPFDETQVRDMRRTTIQGEAPTVAQQAA